MRKLATIRVIDDIRAITNADAIECAIVDGWQCVIRKGEFAKGERVIYCEIDSWIPHAVAPFLCKDGEPHEYYGVKGERLRTVRLRGQISQGLLLPLTVLGHAAAALQIGEDVSELLNIQKWEAPIPACLSGIVIGPWPGLVPKTDQERIQNLDKTLWPQYCEQHYEVTEKLDGTSGTFFLTPDGDFQVCSRNLNMAASAENTFWLIALRHDIEKRMKALGLSGIAIQGEVIGHAIQGNKYQRKDQDIFVFDVFDARQGRYFSAEERRALVQQMGLQHVPVVNADLYIEMSADQNVFLEMAASEKSQLANCDREGIVFKSQTNPNLHFKAISNKWLLKTGG